jgi:hypothetical protein
VSLALALYDAVCGGSNLPFHVFNLFYPRLNGKRGSNGRNLLQEEIFFSFSQTSKFRLMWIIIEINYIALTDHVNQYKKIG